MNEQQYEKISKPFYKNQKGLLLINKVLTALGYIMYPLLLLYTFFYKNEMCIPCILIPASGFILLSFIRKKINKKRPYEALNITPIIKKDTKGNSMPSRHVFSLSIIACSWFVVSPMIGTILIICSILIAIIRVIGGVHYPSDVIVGMLCAILWSLFYFLI